MTLPVQNRIVRMAMFGLVVAYLLVGLVVWREYEFAIDSANNQAGNRALILSEHAARSFEGVDLMMDAALSRMVLTPEGNPELTPGNVEQFKTLIEAVPQIRHLVAIRRDGADTFSNVGPSRGVNLADRKYFQAQAQSENAGLYIDDPVTGRATGSMFIPVSRRISGIDGRFDGVLMGVIDQKYFTNFYRAAEAGKSISSALVSSDGTAFAFSDNFFPSDMEGASHSLAGPELFENSIAGKSNGIYVGNFFDTGEVSIVAFRAISKTPYSIVSRISRNQALSAWSEIATSIGLAALAATVVLIWLTYSISKQMTLRERAEKRVRNLNAELEERIEARTAELRAAQDSLLRKERLAALGQLTGTVAHELRNPLGAIVTSIDVVQRKCSGAGLDLERALGRAGRSIDRCERIITELLDFARAKGLQREPTALDAWLMHVMEEQKIPEGITANLDLQTNGIEVKLDRDTLRRAVINVVENANQAMTEGSGGNGNMPAGELTVAARTLGDRVEIEFADSGPGIPPDILPQVLEPLFSTKSFGTGLGLPTVQQIMEEHGGGLTIGNREGRGVRVILWLPLNRGGGEESRA